MTVGCIRDGQEGEYNTSLVASFCAVMQAAHPTNQHFRDQGTSTGLSEAQATPTASIN